MIKNLPFKYSCTGILFFIFFSLSSLQVNAADLYVNDASLAGDVFTTAPGNDANPGTAGAPFATIQFAINSANSGDVIYIDAGTYVSGDINITKPLTIRGAKFGIIAGPAEFPANRGTNESVVQGSFYFAPATDNITIDGITLDMGTALRGIEARGLNTVIINNIVTGIVNPLVIQQGIATRANAVTRVHSYTISNNNVRNVRYGIFMDGSVENPSLISYNFVTGSISSGYLFTASDGHTIKANVSKNNGRGMDFTEGGNIIQENTIIDNGVSGIRLAGTPLLSGNSIINNFFINNAIGIHLTDDNAGAVNNEAHYNSFTGNTMDIVNTHAALFNATCNWYGTTDAVAIAAKISGNVLFIPYLTDGTDTDPVMDGFQPVITCTVVPVILTKFTAQPKNLDVLLQWQTSSEINSSHFDIEKSKDGRTFYKTGRVMAKGFSDVISDYNFTDNKPENINALTYYRLAMVDRDGTTKYSSIVSVQINVKGLFVYNIYPNPVRTANDLNIELVAVEKGKAEISFVNSLGQVLYNQPFILEKGMNKLQMKAISAGVHYIIIRMNERIERIPVHVN